MRELWAWITSCMSSWHQTKLFVEHSISIEHDALHIMAGAVVWLLLCAAMRRTILSSKPLLWTFAIILWNEVVDLWTERWPDPGRQYGEGVKDLLLTMFVPLAIILFARIAPRIFKVR